MSIVAVNNPQPQSLQLVESSNVSTATLMQTLRDPEALRVLKDVKCKGAKDEEFKAFIALCTTKKLNPFNNEIYFSAYGEGKYRKYFMMVGRHGALRIAERHSGFRGITSFEIREGDDFQFDPVNQKIIKHIPKVPKGKIIGAWAVAKRDGFDDALSVCWLDEFKKEKNPAWAEYTLDMILYKAETRVLRKLFSNEFEGLMLDNFPEKQERMSFEDSYHTPIAKIPSTDEFLADEEDEDEPEYISQAQLTRFHTLVNKYELDPNEVKQRLIDDGYIIDSSKQIQVQHYDRVCELLQELARQGA